MLLAAQLGAIATSAPQPACLQVGNMEEVEVALEGRLTVGEFAGPPNYQDVRRGDALERASLIELSQPICVANGGVERIRRVQLFSSRGSIGQRLETARGHRIRIRGEGFGAHTGHHHTPLVVDVRELEILGR